MKAVSIAVVIPAAVLCLLLFVTNAGAEPVNQKTVVDTGLRPSLSPKQIVNNLYKPYLADPHAENDHTPESLGAIYMDASSGLKQAIDKEKACEQREKGICNIDSDLIINAQDWDLSSFSLKENRQKNHSVVHAKFLNGGQNIVSYIFVQEKGQWKIDDVEAVRFKENGQIDFRYKLKQTLLQQ